MSMELINEEWRPVVGYEGLYEVSSRGNVRGLAREVGYSGGGTRRWEPKLLRQEAFSGKYKRVTLCKDGLTNRQSVHRILAKAFIPNPDGKPWVNHKDGNPSNNHVSNLEWCTPSENCLHGFRVLGRESPKGFNGRGRAVLGISNGEIVCEYPTAAAAKADGYEPGHVGSCCNGRRKTHKKFTWAFKDQYHV